MTTFTGFVKETKKRLQKTPYETLKSEHEQNAEHGISSDLKELKYEV